jgi:hypothetical protein
MDSFRGTFISKIKRVIAIANTPSQNGSNLSLITVNLNFLPVHLKPAADTQI